MKKNLLSYNNFRGGAAWIFLIVGFIMYYCGYFEMKEGPWKELIIKIADVFVIGVVLGYLSNAAQFLGIFKQDLQDIIYGKEFIKQRKDINRLWETISKELFQNKFPRIHRDFLKVIDNYFPKTAVSYYNDYEVHIGITWLEKSRGIIEVIEARSFELISDNENEFVHSFKTWTRIDPTENDIFRNEILEFSVNGENVTIEDGASSTRDGEISQEQHIKLKGSTKYEIKYKRKKIYDINKDYYIGFRAKYIVNKLRVCLKCPDDIKAIFICRGTQEDFEDVNNAENITEKKYKGIILPRQGYIFALKLK